MNHQNSAMGQHIATLLRTYEGNDQFENRDEFFDLLAAAYEDELTDAFSRRGFLLVEKAKCTSQQQAKAAEIQKHLEARDLAGCVVSRYDATSHGGPAILVTRPGRERPVVGVHLYPENIQVIEQQDGRTTTFPYDQTEQCLDFVTARAAEAMQTEWPDISKADMMQRVFDTAEQIGLKPTGEEV